MQRKLIKVEHVVLSKGISKGQAEDIYQRKTLLVGKSVSCNKVGGELFDPLLILYICPLTKI